MNSTLISYYMSMFMTYADEINKINKYIYNFIMSLNTQADKCYEPVCVELCRLFG